MYDEKQFEKFRTNFFETLNKFIVGKENVNLYLIYSDFEETFEKNGTKIQILSNPQKILEARSLFYAEKLQKITDLAKELPDIKDQKEKFKVLTNSQKFREINNKNLELAVICLPALTDIFSVQEINTTWDMLFAMEDNSKIRGLLITKPSYVVDNLADRFLRGLNEKRKES